MARRVAERADDSVLYLYAVTKSGAGDPPQLRGVDGQARIEAIACAGLTCWISRVSASRDASLRKTVPRRAGNVSRDSAIAATARWWRTLTTASQSRSSRRFEKLSPNSEEDTRLIQQVKPAQAIASILACPSTPRSCGGSPAPDFVTA